MATAVKAAPVVSRRSTIAGTTIPFDVVDTPGTYVCNWSGHLLRVTPEAVIPGCAPTLNIVGTEPLTVTKLSDNPDLLLSTAKKLATDLALTTNF